MSLDRDESRSLVLISQYKLSRFQEFLRKLIVRQSFHFTLTSIVRRREQHMQLSHMAGGLQTSDCVALLSAVKHQHPH